MKRNNKKDEVEDDEEEYGEEEEEDEEEEEEDVRGKGKKKRRLGDGLIEDMADVSDDEDDEDEDDGDLGIDENEDLELNTRNERGSRLRATRQMDQDEDHEDLERLVQERYGGADYDDGDYSEDGEQDGIIDQGPLPTDADPKLFAVKCKPGHEREAAICMLQKHFNMLKRGMPLGIMSVVAQEHLKGYVYVEAHKVESVKLAVSGMQLLSQYKIQMVDRKEAIEVMRVPERVNFLQKGDWVRPLRGEYAGDLAQVYAVRVGGGNERTVTVRMIPRLDYTALADRYADEDDADENGNKVKKQGKDSSARRKPQMLFDKDEAQAATRMSVSKHEDRQTTEEFLFFNGEMYRGGLLYKHFTVKSLMSGDRVEPGFEELQMFKDAEEQMQKDPENEFDEDLGLDTSTFENSKRHFFVPGDRVMFVNKELNGLTGEVVSVEDRMVRVRCEELGNEVLEGPPEDITKTFAPGSHVKVVLGERAGDVGVVVKVDGEMATVFSDETKQEYTLRASHLADSTEAIASSALRSSQKSASGSTVMYELFDLVSINRDPFYRGVVVKVEGDSFSLMGTDGNIRTLMSSEILQKIPTNRFARSIDRNRQPVKPGDSVRVVEGVHCDRVGIVKHVVRDALFFQAKDAIVNCGLLVVSSDDVVVQGIGRHISAFGLGTMSAYSQGGSHAQSALDSSRVPSSSGSNAPGAGRPPTSFGFGFNAQSPQSGARPPVKGGVGGSRDALIGQFVKIRKGQMKGLLGRVTDVSGEKVTVELDAKMKRVSILREFVVQVDRNGKPMTGDTMDTSSYASGRSNPGIKSASGYGGSMAGAGGIRGSYNGGIRNEGQYGGAMKNDWRNNSVNSSLNASADLAHIGFGYGATPARTESASYSKTPLHPYGLQTPAPYFGQQTPANYGQQTPGNYGQQTPAHYDRYEPETTNFSAGLAVAPKSPVKEQSYALTLNSAAASGLSHALSGPGLVVRKIGTTAEGVVSSRGDSSGKVSVKWTGGDEEQIVSNALEFVPVNKNEKDVLVRVMGGDSAGQNGKLIMCDVETDMALIEIGSDFINVRCSDVAKVEN
uniref:Transcription elongation factor SPT5 n=1 Tax=Timspurckia oligopyrenoides TaxID=708627 RepID=A0A7S1ET40_9RHOD|mmetsp:Transcript_5591/g.9837  ORF Transcript_5591/g.9837 Transcript_5591/m.9837 type:complete len:1064 (+) Transcript_5591:38-3229(+)